MDPATLSAAAIATLVVTKAFEKSGEVIGEKALEQGERLIHHLQRNFPKVVTAIQKVEEKPEDWGEAVLEVEAAAKEDTEIAKQVQAIAEAVKAQPDILYKVKNIIENNYGGYAAPGGSISVAEDKRNQYFNF